MRTLLTDGCADFTEQGVVVVGIYLTPEMVRDKFAERFATLNKEAQDSLTQRILLHDYECYPNNTLLVTLDIRTGEHAAIWGAENIRRYLRRVFLRDDDCVLVGYNNKEFDNKITDAILAGYDDAGVKRLSNEMIEDDAMYDWKSGFKGKYRPQWVRRTFDIGFDIGQKLVGKPPHVRKVPQVSLKRWERLNGYQVRHCSIPFDKPIHTLSERKEVEDYCLYDVCATGMVVLSDEGWNPCFNARRMIINDYTDRGVDWSMTKPQLTEAVLCANEDNFQVPDNWADQKYTIPDRLRIWKHRDLLDLYGDSTFAELRQMSAEGGYRINVCGIPHDYGIGGVHGRMPGMHRITGGNIFSVDAASLYPNLMRHYDLLSRRVVGDYRDEFKGMIDLRNLVYKPRGDTKAEGLKLMLNSGFGVMGFEKSAMYDPVNFLSVTITGQLLITDLLEKIEREVEIIQTNTDGIFFRLRDVSESGLERCRQIVGAFEARTKLEMEWSEFDILYQRDVSNYVALQKGGKRVKVKGTWFNLKHCTHVPYLYQNRVHKALYDETLCPDGIDMENFAVSISRDKNSECFAVDNVPDEREWLDVVPVTMSSGKVQKIEVICKDDNTMSNTLFGDLSQDLNMRKRRKATGCPPHPALTDRCVTADIDLEWYELDNRSVEKEEETESLIFE